MNSQSEPLPTLVTLLTRHRDEIAVSWAEAVRQLPGSRYREQEPGELKSSAARGLDALIQWLDDGSTAAIDTYLDDISLLRVRLGFDIGEVIEGLLLVRETALPFVWQTFPVGSPQACEAVARLDEGYRLILSRFGRLYADMVHKNLYEQQQRTALMEERQRLARELHDSVTQSMYTVTLYAQAAADLIAAGQAGEAAETLHELRETAQEALREMRLLIFELRPPALEKEGLAAALQARLDAVEARAGLQTELSVEGLQRLPLPLEETLYRVAQEAINNVLKHAHARRVQVHLEFGLENVCMQVSDDGAGFEPASSDQTRGLGLRGMAERLQPFGGALEIKSAPGGGTTVAVEIPIHSS